MFVLNTICCDQCGPLQLRVGEERWCCLVLGFSTLFSALPPSYIIKSSLTPIQPSYSMCLLQQVQQSEVKRGSIVAYTAECMYHHGSVCSWERYSGYIMYYSKYIQQHLTNNDKYCRREKLKLSHRIMKFNINRNRYTNKQYTLVAILQLPVI